MCGTLSACSHMSRITKRPPLVIVYSSHSFISFCVRQISVLTRVVCSFGFRGFRLSSEYYDGCRRVATVNKGIILSRCLTFNINRHFTFIKASPSSTSVMNHRNGNVFFLPPRCFNTNAECKCFLLLFPPHARKPSV